MGWGLPKHATGTSWSVLLNASYHTKHMNIYGLGESQWFLRYKDLKNLLGLGMPPGQPLSLGVQISTFLQNFLLNLLYQINFRTIS